MYPCSLPQVLSRFHDVTRLISIIRSGLQQSRNSIGRGPKRYALQLSARVPHSENDANFSYIFPIGSGPSSTRPPIWRGFPFMFLSDCCSVKASWVWQYPTLRCVSSHPLLYFIWPIDSHPSFHGPLTTATDPTFSITIPEGKHSTVLLFGLSPIYSQPCCKVQATV